MNNIIKHEELTKRIGWLGSMANAKHPNDVETAQYWSKIGHLLPEILEAMKHGENTDFIPFIDQLEELLG